MESFLFDQLSFFSMNLSGLFSLFRGSDDGDDRVDELSKRLDSVESRLDSLESVAARSSEVELLRNELEAAREGRSPPQKRLIVQRRILELVDEGLEKGSIREALVIDNDVCSDSYFYENWNLLMDAEYLMASEDSEGFESLVEVKDLQTPVS